MSSPSGLQLDYLSPAEFATIRRPGVMGVAAFHSAQLGDRNPQVPIAQINTPVLGDAAALCEVWRTGQSIETGASGQVRYTRTADMVFGCISVDEDTADERAAADRTPLHAATETAYREILGTIDRLRLPHLIRVWNYVPEINRDSHGTERYRQFNSARQAALLASGRPIAGKVAAACALGAVAGSALVVYFLASRTAPLCIENPRQVSAYHYPPQYGTRSPIFSRAAMLREPEGLTLFISGTASIVGHRTLHAGDAAAQTRETLANIDALLEEANRVAGVEAFTPEALACKVYVRDPKELPVIQKELCGALGKQARAVYLHADICRRDLSVEIEATAMASRRKL